MYATLGDAFFMSDNSDPYVEHPGASRAIANAVLNLEHWEHDVDDALNDDKIARWSTFIIQLP